ncbi:MAG: hypothetical protein ACKO38_07825 [Planctomycetota bacterium]
MASIGGLSPTHGADPGWEPLPSPVVRKVGSLSCASATCHGNADELVPGEPISGHEQTLWVEFDPHAKAVATLASARYRAVLEAYHNGMPQGTSVRVAADKCAVCHDPQGLADSQGGADAIPLNTARAETAGEALRVNASRPQGIGCEDCHGSAEKWLANHYQRTATRDTLRADGFLDLKHLVTRGRVCGSCHVGDSEHNLTHDMYAAGHPPLRFELSSFQDLIATKHWSERERLVVPAFKLRLWAAGQAAVADAALGQLESRAMAAKTPIDAHDAHNSPWPEFSEYDCFACHQRLRPVDPSELGERGTGGVAKDLLKAQSRVSNPRAVAARPGYRSQLSRATAANPAATPLDATPPAATPSEAARGIPAWQPWNQGLIGLFPNTVFDPTRSLMEARFSPNPSAVGSAAAAGRRALRDSPIGPLGWHWSELTLPDHHRRVARAAATSGDAARGQPTGGSPVDGNGWSAMEQAIALLENAPPTPTDWSDASHRWLALNALARTLEDEWRRQSIPVGSWPELERIATSLRFGSADFDWPRYDWGGLPGRPSSINRLRPPNGPVGALAVEPVQGPPLTSAVPSVDPSVEPLPDLAAIGLQFRVIAGQLKNAWPGRPVSAR